MINTHQKDKSNPISTLEDHTLAKKSILGVGVSQVNMQSAICQIEQWVRSRQPVYVTVTPAHAIMDCYRQPELRAIFNTSGMTTPDGMGIVWILRLMGCRTVQRVYGPDLMLAACERSLQAGWRHYFYGGSPEVLDELCARLSERYPGLVNAGAYTPPFRELNDQEDREVIERIDAANADIVWVGIGSPRKEIWMNKHLGHLNAPIQIGVGAAFDFHSGRKKQAPRRIQRSGFEWLFRLLTEPGRLWKRYIQYPIFVLLVIGQLLGIQKYES